MRRIGTSRRGMLLITSYLLLAIFLVYSNVMTMRSITQRMASDRLRQRYQGTDLAQGSVENLREELYQFLASTIYAEAGPCGGRADCALAWLDTLSSTSGGTGTKFNPDGKHPNGITQDTPLTISKLPTVDPKAITDPNWMPRAWVVRVKNTEDINGNGIKDPGEDVNGNGVLDINGGVFGPRLVTIQGRATVGGLERVVQADYLFLLTTANIFRYAYFLNNFGWMEPKNNNMVVNGDIRANGNLHFGSSTPDHLKLQGNLYASVNPNALDPLTGRVSDGSITRGPSLVNCESTKCAGNERSALDYWKGKPGEARPTRRLTLPGQPSINRTNVVLPEGQGWNTEGPTFPEPQLFTKQKTEPMPYLGDLNLYRQMAASANSSLLYYVKDTRGRYTIPKTISQAYTSTDPLVLIGTTDNPIRIDGPVVVPGDVIIKGVIAGRGTIYAGRNVHVIGQLEYKKKFVVPQLERDPTTGIVQVFDDGVGWQSRQKLGKVCADGTYVPPLPNGTIPSGGC